jgi:hypothetical protein
MAYHDELLAHAEFLATLPDPPRQADMRRAVSAAYYALFHLLTSEASGNWKNINQQARFARIFDHKKLKTASNKISNQKTPSDPLLVPVFENLKLVADNFVTLNNNAIARITMIPRRGLEHRRLKQSFKRVAS